MIRYYKSEYTRQELRDYFAEAIRNVRKQRDSHRKEMLHAKDKLFYGLKEQWYKESKAGIGYLHDLAMDLGLFNKRTKPNRIVESCKP